MMLRGPPPQGQEPPRHRIVDKMLRNLWLAGYIQLMLPEACIVHVVRHPLDAGGTNVMKVEPVQ